MKNRRTEQRVTDFDKWIIGEMDRGLSHLEVDQMRIAFAAGQKTSAQTFADVRKTAMTIDAAQGEPPVGHTYKLDSGMSGVRMNMKGQLLPDNTPLYAAPSRAAPSRAAVLGEAAQVCENNPAASNKMLGALIRALIAQTEKST